MHRVRSLYLCGGGGGGRRCAEEEDSDSVAEGLCQEPQHGRICQEVCGGVRGRERLPALWLWLQCSSNLKSGS